MPAGSPRSCGRVGPLTQIWTPGGGESAVGAQPAARPRNTLTDAAPALALSGAACALARAHPQTHSRTRLRLWFSLAPPRARTPPAHRGPALAPTCTAPAALARCALWLVRARPPPCRSRTGWAGALALALSRHRPRTHAARPGHTATRTGSHPTWIGRALALAPPRRHPQPHRRPARAPRVAASACRTQTALTPTHVVHSRQGAVLRESPQLCSPVAGRFRCL